MNIFKCNLFIILLMTAFFIMPCKSGNHTISTTIEVTQTAVNRYLNSQYYSTGFPRNIPVVGTNYTIYLTLPEVIFTTGNIKMQMIFDVKEDTTLIYHFVIQPSLNVPSAQITGAQIQAFFTNLQAMLDAVTPILPSWVKTNIISNYDLLGWIVYPSKLIDHVNTTWLAQRRINVVTPYFSLGWQVVPGVLSLIVSTYLNSEVPFFSTFVLGEEGDDYIIFKSNIEVKVKEVIIVWADDGGILYHGYPDVTCSKGNEVWINTGDMGVGSLNWLAIKAIFDTDDTWYSREYGYVYVNAGYFGPTKSDN